MIEVVLDGNDNNDFLNQSRPVFVIEKFLGTDFQAYREKAKEIIAACGHEPIIIIRNQSEQCSINKLALALFIETENTENNLECVVFKVSDAPAAIEAYKPYVALTIGIKYVMRLMEENAKVIYKEISLLEYLGLEITHDYIRNVLQIKLPGSGEPKRISTEHTSDALSLIGALKALALAQINTSIQADFYISDENPPFDKDAIINGIINFVQPWID